MLHNKPETFDCLQRKTYTQKSQKIIYLFRQLSCHLKRVLITQYSIVCTYLLLFYYIIKLFILLYFIILAS